MSPKTTKKLKKGHVVAISAITFFIAAGLWAIVFVQYKVSTVQAQGIVIVFPNNTVTLPTSQIGFADTGFQWITEKLEGKQTYNNALLRDAILSGSESVVGTVKNPGVQIRSGQATLDSSSAPGLSLDADQAYVEVSGNLDRLQNHTSLVLTEEQPTVTIENASQAVVIVQKVLSAPVNITVNGAKISLTPSEIGNWIKQTPQGARDYISFDADKVSSDLQKLSGSYTQPEQDLDFDLDSNGKVINFSGPKDGVGIDSTKGAKDVISILQSRIDGNAVSPTPSLVMQTQVVHGGVSAHAQSLGIKELIGTATTPFTGSTKNRIHNISTGAAKLNGSLVQPGQEFSTINTLGDIGPETGYVQELVILGPKTVPAYGGGLCQVSTTLFRSILQAGLPITARANHSYRVSFYEKDGDGKSIGPGLDATIYDPSPDLKFINDTGHPVMVTDQILGTKITFSLYGTADGRTSNVIGPSIVQILPPPPAQKVYSATLPAGEVKQTEFARSGADTTASYEIHYPNGTTKTQIFNSHYHGMPSVFITNDPSAAPPAVAPTPTTTAPAVVPAD